MKALALLGALVIAAAAGLGIWFLVKNVHITKGRRK